MRVPATHRHTEERKKKIKCSTKFSQYFSKNIYTYLVNVSTIHSDKCTPTKNEIVLIKQLNVK